MGGSGPETGAGRGKAMRVSVHRFTGSDWDIPVDPRDDGPRTLLLVFAGSRLLAESEAAAALTEMLGGFPQAVAVGCSTAGEIAGDVVEDDTITVAVVMFASTDLRLATALLPGADASRAAGIEIAEQFAGWSPAAVLVLTPGVDINGSELVRGLNLGLPEGTHVSGGMAADGQLFARTWVLAKGPGLPAGAPDGRSDRLVAAVGLAGPDLVVGHGSQGGWRIFGPERYVTSSSGNVLHELDGRPALALYKSYLGDLAADLPGSALRFPLAVRESDDPDKQLVRTVLAVDEQTQSMHFAGEIPQGSRAQLMWGNAEELVAGARTAALDAVGMPGWDQVRPKLAIAVSCVGRRMLLGGDIDAELEATLEELPRGCQQVGFYSYGELSPFGSGSCDLHNQTMTLTLIGEG